MIKWPWSQEDVEAATKPKTKMIDGYELLFVTRITLRDHLLTPQFRGLFKVYQWYIGRTSPVYDVDYKDGRMALIREQVKYISLDKKKMIDTWTKEKEEE